MLTGADHESPLPEEVMRETPRAAERVDGSEEAEGPTSS